MVIWRNKGLTLRSAQQHGQRDISQFFDYVQQGDLDPSILITHDLPLDEGVRAYDMFKNKTDGCIRFALMPWSTKRLGRHRHRRYRHFNGTPTAA